MQPFPPPTSTNEESHPLPTTAVSSEVKTEKEKPSQSSAALAIKFVEKQNIELFHTPDQQAYASFEVAGHIETHKLASSEFKGWLKRLVYNTYKRTINKQALEETLEMLEAKALYEGEEHEVHLRVAEHDGKYYLDLTNKAWQVIEISRTGWQVLDKSPVKFRRTSHMKALPVPEHGGSVSDLRDYINVRDEDWAQLLAWLVAAYRPQGPYPLLVLHGEQGSAKSTTAKILRSLVDPHEALIRTAPRNDQDVFIGAASNQILAFDNLSSIPSWLSDAFCVLSTGGAFAARQLYSDEEEKIMNVQRPIILTGISELLTREDLMSRAILINLPVIPDSERKTEKELWRNFESAQPKLLGALLNALSSGLSRHAGVTLAEMPRLADFLTWAVACEEALELSPGAIISSYSANVDNTTALALENSLIIEPIIKLVRRYGGAIEMEATQLLDHVAKEASGEVLNQRDFPKRANVFAKQLKCESPNLRRMGIGYEVIQTSGSNSRRLHRLWQLPLEPKPLGLATTPTSEDEGTTSASTLNSWDQPTQPTQSTQSTQFDVALSDDCDGCDDKPTVIEVDGRLIELSF